MADTQHTDTEPTMDAEAAVATMKASNGVVCFRYPSQGYHMFLRYEPDADRFERLRVVTDHVDDTGVDRTGIRVHEYCHCSGTDLQSHLEARLADAGESAAFSEFYTPVAVSDTPFSDIDVAPDTCTHLSGGA